MQKNGLINDLKFEKPACNVCGSIENKILYETCNDRLLHKEGVFKVVKCTKCDLVYTSPRPDKDSIGKYYSGNYYTHNAKGWFSGGIAGLTKSILKYIIYFPLLLRFGKGFDLSKVFGSGVVLDIGCGNGALLQKLNQAGWDVYGLDVDSVAVKTASELVPAAKIFVSDFESVDLPHDTFSLITASHVLEHVFSPTDFLLKTKKLLRKDGKLLIRVPNFGSGESLLFGERWLGLDVPRHLYHFTPATITNLFLASGFSVIYIKPQVLPMHISQSIIYLLNDKMHMNFSSSGKMAKLIYIFTYMPAIFLTLFGNWSSLEILVEPKNN